AGGAGTRLLPATKAQPKEMLPILDTPTIQYVVQEAVDAGISDILFVTGRDKRAIEDHFDRNVELEAHLERRGDTAALESVRALAALATIHYVRQPTQAGLGDAIRCARAFVGDEPFVVLLGDTVIQARVPVTRQLIEAHERHGTPVLAVEHVSREKVGRYGIVEGTPLDDGDIRVERLVEKPMPGETESTMAIAGRYVLTPDVFAALDATPPGRNDEIQLTDALAAMLTDTPMIAVPFAGRRFDIGNKVDYLSTVLAFALERPEFQDAIRSFTASLPDPEPRT
ncbi:MAG: UTP--glucose-1-phosphate uridylyltransferase GalU, partial [Gemmatimonadales bacterium]